MGLRRPSRLQNLSEQPDQNQRTESNPKIKKPENLPIECRKTQKGDCAADSKDMILFGVLSRSFHSGGSEEGPHIWAVAIVCKVQPFQ